MYTHMKKKQKGKSLKRREEVNVRIKIKKKIKGANLKFLIRCFCIRLWGQDWGKCIIQEKFDKPVETTGKRLKENDSTCWCLEHPCHTGREQIQNIHSTNQCLFVFRTDNRNCFTPLIHPGESNSNFFLLTWTTRLRLCLDIGP